MSKVEAVKGEVDKDLEQRGIHGMVGKSVPLKVYSRWTHSLTLPAYFQSDICDKAIGW